MWTLREFDVSVCIFHFRTENVSFEAPEPRSSFGCVRNFFAVGVSAALQFRCFWVYKCIARNVDSFRLDVVTNSVVPRAIIYFDFLCFYNWGWLSAAAAGSFRIVFPVVERKRNVATFQRPEERHQM